MTAENSNGQDGTRRGGPAQRVDDDELVARLKEATNRTEYPPVLSTSDVAELLPIGREAARRRLNDLSNEEEYEEPPVRKYKAGRNPVWWVSETGSGGEVDTGFLKDQTINLSAANIRDLIKAEDIPEDLAARAAVEHGIIEEYSPNTKWESDRSSGMVASTLGFVLIIVAVLISADPINAPEIAVGIIGLFGIAFAVVGFGTLLVGFIMGFLAKFNYVPKDRWPNRSEFRALLKGRIPDFEDVE